MPKRAEVITGVRGAIARLPSPLRKHIAQVRATNLELAELHGLDLASADLAAVSHDLCRSTAGRDLLSMAEAFGLPVLPIDRAVPMFLHGPVAAEVLRHDHGVDNLAVLDPIRYHTMGRSDMSALDKVLFLADKLDPSKVSRYPFIGEVARLARLDLDRAMLHFIDRQIQVFIDHGDLVHPGMAAARNSAVLALKGRGRHREG